MLNTIDVFEKMPEIANVEVFRRGNIPSNPIMIYGSNDKRYPSARTAVIGGRAEDKKRALEAFQVHRENMMNILQGKKLTEDESAILRKTQELYDSLTREIPEATEIR